ncbi:hypothetical protein [Thermoactinomyces mirandus]|uniref:Uncharacterized protein n=1 Tax=Thermoactinomyces mirandus TaxID=2756294 RepID=A0A7W2APY8_9BACL|nr:hypothetical protein [Thermoactinomyces mirandus]MBA4601444.1 hypothetical protein [Thermoactinomyces mirandus]
MIRVIRGLIIICIGFVLFMNGCQGHEELGTGTVVGNEKKVTLMEETDFLVLSEDEQKIYHTCKADEKENCLRKVDPIVVAKLYLYAVLTRDQVMEKALSVQGMAEARAYNKAQSMKTILTGVTKVKFIQTDQQSGYIEYPMLGENSARFQMFKDERGVWKVDVNSFIQ